MSVSYTCLQIQPPMKWSILLILTLPLLSCYSHTDNIHRAGFMYWYDPTPLQADWSLVVSGTVLSLQKIAGPQQTTATAGQIKIHRILYTPPLSKAPQFNADILEIDGGFEQLNIGDKLLVFLVEYENDHAMPDYRHTPTHLGFRLDSFSAPIVTAVQAYLRDGKISDRDQKIWRKYDPRGLNHYLEKAAVMQQIESTNN